jgi:hypothetical protein
MTTPRNNIEPAGPRSDQAKKAQEERHEKRQDDFDQADSDDKS